MACGDLSWGWGLRSRAVWSTDLKHWKVLVVEAGVRVVGHSSRRDVLDEREEFRDSREELAVPGHGFFAQGRYHAATKRVRAC